MNERRLVTPEEAERIGREVRDDFHAAVEETRRLGEKLDQLSHYEARQSPPPTGSTALRAVRV
jgi:hypothetical protein